jgi:hypothetical protein
MPTEHPPLYGDGTAAEHCLNALLESDFSRKENGDRLK